MLAAGNIFSLNWLIIYPDKKKSFEKSATILANNKKKIPFYLNVVPTHTILWLLAGCQGQMK